MSHVPHIVFLDRATIPAFIQLKPFTFECTVEMHDNTPPHLVAKRIENADIVITNKVRIDNDSLSRASLLKLVAISATGTNVVDVKACEIRGCVVSNIRNYAVNSVPEHALALIFALRRSLIPYHASVKEGRWQQSGQFCYFDYPIKDLANSTLGIFGSGALGSSLANLARGLGMKTVFASRKGQAPRDGNYRPFDEVVETSDILSLHLPLTPETRNMISDPEFDRMKPSALLINTARGGLVDEEALVRAIKGKKIGGAAFDVVTTEPMPDSHPFMALMDYPNFILTPHVAWASEEAIQALADQLINNINAFVRGEIRNQVFS